MSIAQEKSDIRWFENLTSDETTLVGGKNASLGEMIRTLKEEGVDVPDGFATTADTYRQFLKANNLTETIQSHLKDLQSGAATLEKVGKSIRRLFWYADFPEEMTRAIQAAYTELSRHYGTEEVDVALTLPSLKAWGFSLLRESLESTELNPDTFPDLKTAHRAFFGIAHPYLEVIRSRGFLKEGA